MNRFLVPLLALLVLVSCTTTDPDVRAKRGAAIGAAAGAIAGAVIGNQSGNPQTGAVVGAIVGAGVGTAIGRRMDQQQEELRQIEGVEVTRTAEDELNIVLLNNILFDYDSATLRPESRRALREMAGVFVRFDDTTIEIEGHTDSIGSDAYNQGLSERRAGSVAGYLAEEGVAWSRMRTIGYGRTRPVADNATPEGRQLNRRVEIHVRARS
jgi:outer membrane protein OmpA-like peptidoglycan-associated protein